MPYAAGGYGRSERSHRLKTMGLAIAGAAWLCAGPALAAETVRLAVQKTGTVAWELDVIRTHGLDEKHGITIEATELASPEAGKVGLRGGSVDVIVTDWLWVSRERSLGHNVVFYPFSSTVGAVMVPADSSIKTIADLKGKKIAVAGGPLDKSWLLLQGAAKQEGVDLVSEAEISYGAPPLLAEKTRQGEMDAMLNYWNFCAVLEAEGYGRLVGVEELLPRFGVDDRTTMLGYIFDEEWARENPEAIAGFIAASREAKEILGTSDAEWERLAPIIGVDDPNILRVYRERFREGIPRRSIDEEVADARIIYEVLAELGGEELVGEAEELAPGTFYQPDAAATPQ